MDIGKLLADSIWAGVFAAALGVGLTTLPKALAPSFICGFAARLVRDLLIGSGVSLPVAVAAAAACCVVVGAAFVRSQPTLSMIALVTGVLPLGAAVALFDLIENVVALATLKGPALTQPTLQLAADFGVVVITTTAIALGLLIGFVITAPIRRAKGNPEV
jgi:uncharacterized membrane protein YjjB (DUF3815 family)